MAHYVLQLVTLSECRMTHPQYSLKVDTYTRSIITHYHVPTLAIHCCGLARPRILLIRSCFDFPPAHDYYYYYYYWKNGESNLAKRTVVHMCIQFLGYVDRAVN